MTAEPRSEADYSPRQTEAARRVLVDIGQVLASFADCLVVVGGWTPDLLLSHFGRVKTLAFRRQLQHRLWSTTRMGYRHGARVFEIHRHFVWTTTYRKPVVTGEVGLRVRELVRQVCREDEAAAAAAM